MRAASSHAETRAASSLIIISGYLRYFRLGLEGLRRQVLAANPLVQFDIALFTSTRVLCTDRDRVYGDCPCFEPIPRNITELVNSALAAELGLEQRARLVHIIHNPVFYKGHEGGIGARFPTRLMMAFETLGQEALAGYHNVLVIRPDVVLAQPVNLHRLCKGFPGIQIIGGIETRPMVSEPGPTHAAQLAAFL